MVPSSAVVSGEFGDPQALENGMDILLALQFKPVDSEKIVLTPELIK